ncbi:TlpA family protein disulfide reductase [Paenibacillus sp. 1-18]|uniref:TlpA family protein disulfide reductase n=1 Tax=Paenibacillus sp. 1-18 TaxID=1333846 RepID=UPI00047246EA|nr:TlpA disulfide reductase family protein [Paenibacillus sp. 1-18]
MIRVGFIRLGMAMLVAGAASGLVIANTAYATSLPNKNVLSQEEHKDEEGLGIELAVEADSDAIEVIKKLKPGQRLPSMILKDLKGNSYDVAAPRNKPLVISFWASWCDPCRLEAPMLNELYRQYKHDVDVYGINVTRYDRLEDVRKFSRSLGLQFPILLDEQGTLFERFGGAAFPTHVLVDHHGLVHEIIIGMLSEQELKRKIQMLQKKKVSLRF